MKTMTTVAVTKAFNAGYVSLNGLKVKNTDVRRNCSDTDIPANEAEFWTKAQNMSRKQKGDFVEALFTKSQNTEKTLCLQTGKSHDAGVDAIVFSNMNTVIQTKIVCTKRKDGSPASIGICSIHGLMDDIERRATKKYGFSLKDVTVVLATPNPLSREARKYCAAHHIVVICGKKFFATVLR